MIILLLACAQAPAPSLVDACAVGDAAVFTVLNVDVDSFAEAPDYTLPSIVDAACLLVDPEAWTETPAFVPDAFRVISYAEKDTTITAGVTGRHLRVYFPLDPGHVGASVLYHESLHATSAAPGHVRCAFDPERATCDDDWTGAYGQQAALLETAIASDVWASQIDDAIDNCTLHINN